jgi:hypothetical protein
MRLTVLRLTPYLRARSCWVWPSGVERVGEILALLGSEAIGGGLGPVRDAVYQAFD